MEDTLHTGKNGNVAACLFLALIASIRETKKFRVSGCNILQIVNLCQKKPRKCSNIAPDSVAHEGAQ